MDKISQNDRERLRFLARRKLEFAVNVKNDKLLRQWQALAEGRREEPTVRLLFWNFRKNVIDDRLLCESKEARMLEENLLDSMAGRELFDDDTPVSPTYDVCLRASAQPFKSLGRQTQLKNSIGFHIEPLTDNIEADIDLFEPGQFFFDEAGTKKEYELADEIFGDILPPRMVMSDLTGAMTNPLVAITGLENYYYGMMDSPEALHRIMDSACSVYERFYDELEKRALLLPTVGISPIHQESFAFNNVLPADQAEKTTDVWGFLEAQETTAVSPEDFGEFVFPYQERLAKRFGLLSYGCCERVDNIFENYLSKLPNLRKLSVSPFNDEEKVGAFLRGTNIVYYSKPRAEYLTNPGPLDEDRIRAYFKTVAEHASGCILEVAQREAGTLFGDFNRGKEYVRLAKETINTFWQP